MIASVWVVGASLVVVAFVVNAVEFDMSEQELIFRMFVCEYMEWYSCEYTVISLPEGVLGKKICDALRCE